MKQLLVQAKSNRKFVDKSIQIESWESIRTYFEILEKQEINSIETLQNWMLQRSELESVLEEEMAWRYILMSCDTSNQECAQSFQNFVALIDPEIQRFSNVLDKKLLSSSSFEALGKEFFIPKRAVKKRDYLFCDENVPIFAEIQQQEQEYGLINSKMTINYDGIEKTLQQAAVYLKNTDRNIREEVFTLINNRRFKDVNSLNELLTSLIEKRHKVAQNAGFENYRDYKFQDLGRFDYTKEDCFDFHSSIQKTIPPIIAQLHIERKQKLSLSELRPWDLEVDIDNKAPLKPFETSEELIKKTIACFTEIRPSFGKFIQIMVDNGYMDLDSRIGKAPGGFNYPLYESNVPFIFMNSAGTLRDIETIVHEGGHAIHSFLSAQLPLVEFKSLPSEVAELASMSMELISMEHWHHFFENSDDLKRAKRSQLEGILAVLPWVAIVDKFQHRLYENPKHTIEEREKMWLSILKEFETNEVDWNGWKHIRKNSWQKQLHIFEVPFYYIEYGIAQLGAIAMWKQYKENKESALNNYESFLKLGYSVTIPEIYKTAGIEFSFSYSYVKELIGFVQKELQNL